MVESSEVQALPPASEAVGSQNGLSSSSQLLPDQPSDKIVVWTNPKLDEGEQDDRSVSNGIIFRGEHVRPSTSQEMQPCYDGKLVIAESLVKEEEEEATELLWEDVEEEADNEDEDEEEEDDLEERGQDVEECSSAWQAGKKGCRRLGWRKKSQQKMDHAKQWIMDNLVMATSVSMVSLSSVEKAYSSACFKEGQEPLTKFVLARLIHEQFPAARKCRLGSRGHQKIHYSNLCWKVNRSCNQHHLKATTSRNVAEEETPTKDRPVAKTQDKGKKAMSSVSRKETLCPAKEALARAAVQPLPEGEEDDEEGCENAAKRLTQVVKWIKSQGKFDVLLKTFAHSASCNRLPCCPLCLMFRRVRRHVVSARHDCYVLRIYSIILKLHVGTCDNNNCGMTACPALRASRQLKRGRAAAFQEEEDQQEEEIQLPTKKHKVMGNRPSSLPLSPASSQSDSPSSTPSPSGNQNFVFPPSPPSPIRIVPLPPVRRLVVVSPAERGGA